VGGEKEEDVEDDADAAGDDVEAGVEAEGVGEFLAGR